MCAQSGENGGWANLLLVRLELHWRNNGGLPYFLRTKSNKKQWSADASWAASRHRTLSYGSRTPATK